jgi:hypothetical protein
MQKFVSTYLVIATRYALSVDHAAEQARAYVTSVSDSRRRVCDSHL